jgi:hypothetical protein
MAKFSIGDKVVVKRCSKTRYVGNKGVIYSQGSSGQWWVNISKVKYWFYEKELELDVKPSTVKFSKGDRIVTKNCKVIANGRKGEFIRHVNAIQCEIQFDGETRITVLVANKFELDTGWSSPSTTVLTLKPEDIVVGMRFKVLKDDCTLSYFKKGDIFKITKVEQPTPNGYNKIGFEFKERILNYSGNPITKDGWTATAIAEHCGKEWALVSTPSNVSFSESHSLPACCLKPKNNDNRTTCYECSGPLREYGGVEGMPAVGKVCTVCGK